MGLPQEGPALVFAALADPVRLELVTRLASSVAPVPVTAPGCS